MIPPQHLLDEEKKRHGRHVWECFSDVTEVFLHLSKQSYKLSQECFERFVIVMYSKTCDVLKLNKAR